MTRFDQTVAAYQQKYDDCRVEVDKIGLHYTDWNRSGSNDVILMLHGMNVQLHTWDPIADVLAQKYRVLLLDLRGHGDSDWTSDYFLSSFVHDIHGFLSELQLPEVHLVGHSQGARIGYAFAGEYPDRVRSLVLSDNAPSIAPGGVEFARKMANIAVEARAFKDEAAALDFFKQQHPEWQEIFLRLHARYQVKPNWIGRLVRKDDPEVAWITYLGKSEVPYLWDICQRIAAPTLLLRGGASEFVDDELAARTIAAISRCEVDVIPDCGHYIPRQRPVEFVDATVSFIERHTSSWS